MSLFKERVKANAGKKPRVLKVHAPRVPSSPEEFTRFVNDLNNQFSQIADRLVKLEEPAIDTSQFITKSDLDAALEDQAADQAATETSEGPPVDDSDTSVGTSDPPEDASGELEGAVPTTAPPAVAAASDVGTTSDPPVFALSDHTHRGVDGAGGVFGNTDEVAFWTGSGANTIDGDDGFQYNVSAARVSIRRFSATVGNAPTLRFLRGRGSSGSPSATQSGDFLGIEEFRGTDDGGTPGFPVGVLIEALTTENWTTTANGAELCFFTTPNGSSSQSEVLCLRQDGTVEATSGNMKASQLESTVSTGTPPLIVASTDLVDNLNADLLDGFHASELGGPYPVFRIVGWAQKNPGTAASASVHWVAARINNGTVTSSSSSTGQWLNFATSTVANTNAGWDRAEDTTHREFGPVLDFVIETGTSTDLAATRLQVGFADNDVFGGDVANLRHVMMFQFSTNAGNTTWHTLTNDGSASAVDNDSGVTVAASTRYELRIDASAVSSVDFYINGTLVTTHTTQLPTSTTTQQVFALITNLTGGTARNFKISRFQIYST